MTEQLRHLYMTFQPVRCYVRVCRLTSEAGAGVAVPVVAAVAVDRTGVGAAGVGHAAARLHVHLPRLRQTQSASHPQTLQSNKQTREQLHRSTLCIINFQILQANLQFLQAAQVLCLCFISEMCKIREKCPSMCCKHRSCF